MAAVASGDVIDIGGNIAESEGGYGAFVGSIQYQAGLFATEGTVTISLTNTSDPGNGGYITGFLFNINSLDIAANAILQSSTHAAMLGVQNESGSPFGDFDAGAALGGNFLGNGNPADGIGVGDTGVFEFLVSASDAVALGAMSFITGPNQHNFLVRFRGFENEESDKVPGIVLIPAPGAMALLMAAGLVGTRRRRN